MNYNLDMRLEIKRMGINGEGIGYDHKIPVFVEGALENEIVDVRITADHKTYKNAVINRIIEESEKRVIPPCPYYRECGACTLSHTTYENQLLIKKGILEEALNKYAEIEADVDVVPNPDIYGYRNSFKLPFGFVKGKLVLGFYERESNRFVSAKKCMIHEELLETVKEKVLEILNRYHMSAYDNREKKGMRYLVLRVLDKHLQMCLVTGNDRLNPAMVEELIDIERVVSLYQSINTSRGGADIFGKQMIHLKGSKTLDYKIAGLKASLGVRSFYQLNSKQSKHLYNTVLNKIEDGEENVVEAYCGIGIMSLLCARKVKQVTGIEVIPDAISNARSAAKRNGISNAEFICGDAGMVLRDNFRSKKISTLIVDPPRSGLDDTMLETIMKSKISRIVYVSCNPATLAKNLFILKDRYSVDSIETVDMFSNTAHVETVVLMSKMNTSR